jgi:hypothetical protein
LFEAEPAGVAQLWFATAFLGEARKPPAKEHAYPLWRGPKMPPITGISDKGRRGNCFYLLFDVPDRDARETAAIIAVVLPSMRVR